MSARLIVSAYRGRAKMYLEANGCGNFDEVHDVLAACNDADVDDHTFDQLARSISGYVRQAHEAHMFDELILVAPGPLLDKLKREIGERPQPHGAYSTEDDRTRLSPQDLCEWLRERRPVQ